MNESQGKMKIFIFLLILIEFTNVHGSFINPYPRFKEYRDDGDPGEPLYLTPLIEKGEIDEARNKAAVTESQFSFVKSYSGYLTVNKALKSNMFFWYFPPEHNVDNSPVIIWLQGGPGASSLFGLFTENGPFVLTETNNGTKIIPRKYRWNINNHLIYFDNPVGTGFSFTGDKGYVKNEKEVGRDLYEAVCQLFTLFPELQTQDLWVTGESYAGKYVPALAYKIHMAKQRSLRKGIPAKVPIRLKGFAIGNGLSDPIHQLHYGDYLYQLGLIDSNGLEIFHNKEKVGVNCIKSRNMSCAFEVFDTLINMDQSPQGSVFYNLTGLKSYFNYINPDISINDALLGAFLQSSDVRKAIHVGNNTFNDLNGENKVEINLKDDIMDSVALWVAELLDNGYRGCIYNGQLDIIVAYPLTENYLHKLKFKEANLYHKAPRYIWRIDNEVAGYVKETQFLVDVLVRNAGHMAPSDQPKWVFDMITRLTRGKSFYSG